ncbi:hypothetical protein [Tardiphaga sp. vice154]|uniref:hypothetical protein n=1 Tax=Tardiphaga sp. vice154 TaxID=2592814 RepID=UPI00143DC147|nr:hypothetical protein [Tardiphaga sp. vice154]
MNLLSFILLAVIAWALVGIKANTDRPAEASLPRQPEKIEQTKPCLTGPDWVGCRY